MDCLHYNYQRLEYSLKAMPSIDMIYVTTYVTTDHRQIIMQQQHFYTNIINELTSYRKARKSSK